jgi:hypothetical protein
MLTLECHTQEVQHELEVVQGFLREKNRVDAMGLLQTKFEKADAEREKLSEEVTQIEMELDATTEERDTCHSELKQLKVTTYVVTAASQLAAAAVMRLSNVSSNASRSHTRKL